MLPIRSSNTPWRPTLTLLLLILGIAAGQEPGATRDYAATPIYDFGRLQAFGPLVGKPVGDFFGITNCYTSGYADSMVGQFFKVSPEGKVTNLYTFPSNQGRCFPHGFEPMSHPILDKDGNLFGVETLMCDPPSPDNQEKERDYVSDVYRITPTGDHAIIHKFTARKHDAANGSGGQAAYDVSMGPLLEDKDGALYGVTHTYRRSSDNEYPLSVFRVDHGGSGFTILYSVTPKSGTAWPDTWSPVQGTDGNIYVLMPSVADADIQQVVKLTGDGAVTAIANLTKCNTLTAGQDGGLYTTQGNTILRISTDGAVTTFHKFDSGEGSILSTLFSSPFVPGPGDALYGVCSNVTASGAHIGDRTIFCITKEGKYRIVGQIKDAPSVGWPYSLTPISHGGFYEINGSTLSIVHPTGKHISLNFTGSDIRDAAGTLHDTDNAGMSPSDQWVNLAGAIGTKQVADEFGDDGPTVTWHAEAIGKTAVLAGAPTSDTKPEAPDKTPPAKTTNNFDDTANGDANRQLMRGYLDTKADKPITIDIWGLPTDFVESGYDVYVYCNGGTDLLSCHGKYKIATTEIPVAGTQKEGFNGTYVKAADGITGNYVLFSKLNDRSFTLTVSADLDKSKQGHAVVNGIQIVQRVDAKPKSPIVIIPQRSFPLRP